MSNPHPIAVVGVSAIFPGSVEKTGFWSDILRGTDLMSDVPPTHWLVEDYYDPDPSAPDKTYAKRGAFLPDVPFDPLEFGVPPTIVPATDSNQLLALIVAKRVLEDAANAHELDREKVSVILGVTSAQELLGSMVSRLQRPFWVAGLRQAGIPEDEVQKACEAIASNYVEWQESTFPGVLGNVVAGRIANRLDLHGTNCVTDAACASSFSALSMAVNELQLGQSDLVITGGCDAMNDIFMYMCFSKTPALSRSGDCRPFSDQADGTMLGEGLGMVALKRLDDAERDGDTIYAVIKGVGTSSDGRAKSVYAPVPEGQARAVRRAYEQAGYGPETVELVEAHGTGTIAGDAAEFSGIAQVFAEAAPDRKPWCALGSVKSQIGHTKSAAGAAGLFKIVMALHHKVLPPTIKVDRPNPKLSLDTSAFYLNTTLRPWIRNDAHPRRASVSSFGFGGSNFHLAVEEYTGNAPAKRLRTTNSELVLLSADTPEQLAQLARSVAAESQQAPFLHWKARNSQETFAGKPARLAVIAQDEAELAQKLLLAADRIGNTPFSLPNGVFYATGAELGEVAFLFPGQGSQYLRMAEELLCTYDAARGPWDRASLPLHDVVFPIGAFDEATRERQRHLLTATEWAQPALGAASLSALALLDQVGLKPACVGGHSYGEVTALHAAGVLSETDMLRVARRRGELMAEAASQPGSMSAVRASAEEVEPVVAGLDVVLANRNSPTQTVLSGRTEAIEAAEGALAAAGLTAKRLNVATAFHSEVVSASTTPFRAFLDEVDVQAPRIPVYANSTGAPYSGNADAIRALLAKQIAEPVRFVEQIEAMYASGVRTFVEVGPGRVLCGLVEQILGDRPHQAIAVDRKGKPALDSFHLALGALVVNGATLDLASLWAEFKAPIHPDELPKQRLTVHINGSNYGKPYPPKQGAAGRPKPNPPREPVVQVKEVIREVVKEVPAHVPVQAAAPPPGPPSALGTPPLSTGGGPEWMATYQAAQLQTATAHAAYQQAMADSHQAFLGAVQASMNTLATLATGQPSAPTLQVPVPQQTWPQTPAAPPVWSAPSPSPLPEATPSTASWQAPPRQSAAPVPAPVPVATAAHRTPAQPEVDLQALLLDVVAEKTGYPAEMLGLEMQLEADLGIDSIKRVEILSAMRERAPNLPEVDAAEMASLQTLGQIVAHMGANLPASPSVIAPPRGSQLDLKRLLLEVVAEKTGYPAEMLGLEMQLEADLGIDSIKRVEILSAMREQAPDLPEVDAGAMASLQTLGQIVDHMAKALPAAPVSRPAAPVLQPAAAPGVDLERLLLEVVAEKTGYPAEMLGMEMQLEADLGIDSIKRVEILSSLRERASNLPEVDAGAMASLQTLGQIVQHMGAVTSGTHAAAPTPAPLHLQDLLLDVVAEKTGYPAEMLGLEMKLEADLGIDSIKRVEILSAMRERAPDLPEVDAAAMAQLQTLGQIVAFMGDGTKGPDPSPAAEVDSAPVAPRPADLGRYVLDEVEAPSLGLSQPGLEGRIAIPKAPCAGELASLLTSIGVEAFVGNPDATTTGLILLGGLTELGDIDDALAVNKNAFRYAKQVAARLAQSGGLLVTVQDTGGDFGLSGSERAWIGGLAGLAKTARQEWPLASVKAIDVERGQRSHAEIARALLDELVCGGLEAEVGLHADGRRTTLVSSLAEVEGGSSVLGQEDIVVASGGARGVTAATLIALAKDCKARFVLLGRTALQPEPSEVEGITADADLKRTLLQAAKGKGESLAPAELGRRVKQILAGREIRATVAAIEAAGGSAQYVSADVTDKPRIAAELQRVRSEWGPITALVHGAGVLADRFIADKTPEQFDFVFDTKIEGLRALLSATEGDPLKCIVLFSSVAARCGNQGQCDYAMANEVLNKVGALWAKHHPTCVVKSLGWGPWEGGMVTPALKERFLSLGVPLIPLDAGAKMFVDEIQGSDVGRIELVLGGSPTGDSLLDSGEPRPEHFGLHVHADRHPYLEDHSLQGQVVVPAVFALEWFARAACSTHPELTLREVRDLKVLKGIAVDDFSGRGAWLVLELKQVSNGTGAVFEAKLSRGERVHYAATIELASSLESPRVPSPLPGVKPWSGALYGDVLFHGELFQVLSDVEVNQDGAQGQIATVHTRGWPGPWTTDPAALDGALQLALLYTQHALGGASLPTGISSFKRYTPQLPKEAITAVLHRKRQSASKVEADVHFLDGSGTPVFALLGIETHLLPRPTQSTGAPLPGRA